MWRAGIPTELELGLREVRRRKTVIRGGSGRSVVAGSGPCAAANVKVDRRCGADRPQPSPPPAPHYHRDGLRARSTVRSNEWLGAFVETGESLPAEVCSVLQE